MWATAGVSLQSPAAGTRAAEGAHIQQTLEDWNQRPLHSGQEDLGCPEGSGEGLHSCSLFRGNTLDSSLCHRLSSWPHR